MVRFKFGRNNTSFLGEANNYGAIIDSLLEKEQ